MVNYLKKIKYNFILISFITGLSACGGGGSDSGGSSSSSSSSSSGGSSGGGSALRLDAPIVPLACIFSEGEKALGMIPTGPNAGKMIYYTEIRESGTNGGINYDCETDDYDTSGATLNITQVKREASVLLFDASIGAGAVGKVVAKADYAAGTNNIKVTRGDLAIYACDETYNPAVPELITDPSSLKDLAKVYKGDDDPNNLTSTCTDSDEDPHPAPPLSSSFKPLKTIFLANFDATDETNAKHLVAIKTTFIIDIR